MRVILYILMVAAAALNTYHPKKQAAPAAPVQAGKPVAVEKVNSNVIAFNDNGTSLTIAPSN